MPADVVLARVDGRPTLVLVPPRTVIDVSLLIAESSAVLARLASADEFSEIFPGYAPGTMPPLARLFGVDVFADRAFARTGHDADILLPLDAPGTRREYDREWLALRWADFVRLTNPLVGQFVGPREPGPPTATTPSRRLFTGRMSGHDDRTRAGPGRSN